MSELQSTKSIIRDSTSIGKHIRPKLIRRGNISKREEILSTFATKSREVSKDNVDDLLEQTRIQMENTSVSCSLDENISLSSSHKEDSIDNLGIIENREVIEGGPGVVRSVKPKGILKQKRRYGPRPSSQSNGNIQKAQTEDVDGSGTSQTDRDSVGEKDRGMSFFKDIIVERPVVHDKDKMESIDECRGDTTNHGERKVVRSLSELVSLASNLHAMESSSSGVTNSETIEAHMEFSCMPQEEYDDLVKQAKSSGLPIEKYLESLQEDDKEGIDSKEYVNGDDEGDDDGTDQDEEDDSDDIFDFFGGALAEEEERPPPPLRAFMVLWNAISRWITADAVVLLRSYKNDKFVNQEPPLTVALNAAPNKITEMSDICASRCAGLMNMLKINLIRSLDELGYSTSDNYTRRMAETRLGEFVQKFDFTDPMVKFNSIQWRALTIILLSIVLPRHDLAYEGKTGIVVRDEVSPELALPNTLKEVGMSVQEYKYLVDTAIPSLDVGSG
jgi:hypothetical protein